LPPSRVFTKKVPTIGDDGNRAQHQRIHHAVPAVGGEGNAGNQHGSDDGDRIGFEQVGGHTGAVADVVTDVVGNDGRIARVIFRDSGLDLADQVGTDIGTLGENTSAETGEDGNQRAAEGQADHRLHRGLDRFGGLFAAGLDQHEITRDVQQAKTDHQHAGDGAALEADIEGIIQAAGGGLSGAHIGAHGNEHADEAGKAGQYGADGEADGGLPAQRRHKANDYKQHDAYDGDSAVLAAQIGAGAFLHGGRDRLHFVIPGILLENPAGGVQPVNDGQGRAGQSQFQSILR